MARIVAFEVRSANKAQDAVLDDVIVHPHTEGNGIGRVRDAALFVTAPRLASKAKTMTTMPTKGMTAISAKGIMPSLYISHYLSMAGRSAIRLDCFFSGAPSEPPGESAALHSESHL